MKPKRPFTESELIQWIRKTARSSRHPLGIGDDAAILDAAPSGQIVLTTDMLLEGTHFESGTSPYRIGWKAAGRSLSDVAAMGCPASAVTACIVFPKGSETKSAREIVRGMRALCDKFEVPLIGGDVSAWDGPLAINVTAIGDVGKKPALLRSGAKVGDQVFVSGSLGGSILGRHLRFEPRLELGNLLNQKFKINAMIDISDGLACDLNHILDESCAGAVLFEKSIPVSSAARKLARKTGAAPLEHALPDGEDYELLFTTSNSQAEKILKASLPVSISSIGKITRSGLTLSRADGSEHPLYPRGYEHQLS